LLAVSLALTVLQGLGGTGLHPEPAKGPSSIVIAVIVPEGATSSMVDALNRLRGEATSLGFEIRLVEPLRGATPQAKLERVARDLSPAAVVALSSDEQAVEDKPPIRAVDVWFLDRASGRTSVGHLPFEKDAGDRAEQAVAVGVVDFIRARMFDSLVQASIESKVERPRGAPPIPLRGYQVSAGLGAIGSFSGSSSALLLFVETSFALRPWLRLSLSAGGLGTQVRRRTAAGSVDIEQRLLKAGATFVAPSLARRWYLYAETGLAMLFVAARGEGSSGYAGQAPTGSSLGVHCLGGVLLAFTSHVVLQSSLGTLWLFREQQVFIADDQVARTGRPTWLASAMLGVMF
jgi:hypothetical protein